MSGPGLRTLPVPPGAGALGILVNLQRAMDGSGPALAPYVAGGPPPQIPHGRAHLPQGLALTIGTSGSTGPPKLAMLTGDALRASADATHVRLGDRGTWLLAMPAHHIAGIQVLVRSLVAGTTPVAMDLEGGFTPAAFARATAEIAPAEAAYTALVPTQLVRLLESAEGRQALTRYAAVLVGGAATPSGVIAKAKQAGIRVVTTYGMSETAGGCVYDGRALDVSDAQLENDGRIRLGGATLAQGYLNEPALSAKAFVVDDAAGWWFRTDDVGHLDDRGTLIVDGRMDDQINTGGLKVAPRQVEEALTGLDNVSEAVVVGSPDPEWGQLVSAAIVVTQGGSPPTLDEVRDRLRGILPDHALPRRLAALAELPLLGPGKADRAAVRRHFDHDH
ncbi:MAG TPA: o-succinylbenzoate--CoA ligase [Dermatophilaceae bacterium]